MARHDHRYLELLQLIQLHGVKREDRTGVGTTSLFGPSLRFNLQAGFPLLTTKKVPLRWVFEELRWMLEGHTDEGVLRERGVDIWKEWATEEQTARFFREPGDLGPTYGHQWRRFGAEDVGFDGLHKWEGGVDQIRNALDLLANNPDSRRILVTGWNPAEATEVALPPCHTLFQFAAPKDPTSRGGVSRVLHCHMYQRSADVFLGVPFNIASYALLTHMFAHVLDFTPGVLAISFGDAHIYRNHEAQVAEQMSRPVPSSPKLAITKRFTMSPGDREDPDRLLDLLLSLRWSDIELTGYNPLGKIEAEVAV